MNTAAPGTGLAARSPNRAVAVLALTTLVPLALLAWTSVALSSRAVEDQVRAFSARCYLACSVMLGVASEQAFRGLAGAFVAANGEQYGKLGKLRTRVRFPSPAIPLYAVFSQVRGCMAPLA